MRIQCHHCNAVSSVEAKFCEQRGAQLTPPTTTAEQPIQDTSGASKPAPLDLGLAILAAVVLFFLWAFVFKRLEYSGLLFGESLQASVISGLILMLVPLSIVAVFTIIRPTRRSFTKWIGLGTGAIYALAVGAEDGFGRLFFGDNALWGFFTLVAMSTGCFSGGTLGEWLRTFTRGKARTTDTRLLSQPKRMPTRGGSRLDLAKDIMVILSPIIAAITSIIVVLLGKQ